MSYPYYADIFFGSELSYANGSNNYIVRGSNTPSKIMVAYVEDTVKSWVQPIFDENEEVILYDFSKTYIVLRYIDENGDSHDVVDNEVYFDKYSKSDNLAVRVVSSIDSIYIEYLEYITKPSGKLQGFFLGDGEPKTKITLGVGESWVIVDTENNPIVYNNSKKYIGIRYRTQTGTFKDIDNNRESGIYLDKVFNSDLNKDVLAIFNNTDSSIDMRSIEYKEE